MKPTIRLILLTVVLPLSVVGLITAIVFTPGGVEGAYSPISSYGCAGDQFMEIRDGRMVSYVMCSNEGTLHGYYEKDPSGSLVFRLSSDKSSNECKPWARVEPHLLGAWFYYLDSGESEWKWKRYVTSKMKNHMVTAAIKGVESGEKGVSSTTYDYQFHVLDVSFRPKLAVSPAPAP